MPVVILALIGCALYIEQQGFRLPSNADESLLIDEDAWYAVQNPNAGAIASNAPKCLIVFDKNDDDTYYAVCHELQVISDIDCKGVSDVRQQCKGQHRQEDCSFA